MRTEIITKQISNSLLETQNIAKQLASKLKRGDLVIFNGELGVGKTEFIKSICHFFGIEQIITSPTFTLINQYETFYFGDYLDIFHIDLYRIRNRNELIELGFCEIISDIFSLKFIEWAENSFDLLTNFDYKVTILADSENELRREIIINSVM